MQKRFIISTLTVLCILLIAIGPIKASENSVWACKLIPQEFQKMPQGIQYEKDYGSFLWALGNDIWVSQITSNSVPIKSERDQYTIILGEQTIDTTNDKQVFPAGYSPVFHDGPDLHIVQFNGPIHHDWIQLLNDYNLKVVTYIHPFSYIVWGNLTQIHLIHANDNVHWTGHFAPAYRVLPKWRDLNSDQIQMDVLLIRDADPYQILKNLQSMGATLLEVKHLTDMLTIAGIEMNGRKIQQAALIPGIYSIQPRPTDGGLRSEMSNQVNANNIDTDNLAFPGYSNWLVDIELDGSGVIMANVDSGIQETHPDLINRIIPCFGTTCGGSQSSTHGTHTAGIMAADASSGVMDNHGFLRGLGMAPGASLIEQVYSPYYQQTDGMLLLMSESYANGASLSSNSWGPSSSPHGYDNDTLQVDIGVRDADDVTPGNQSMSYILSFMNGNGGTSSQGTPDEAKNIFTIGSTKMRFYSGSQDTEINDLSSNSAHGPALDGRTIPHLVAPGCYVDSTQPGSYGLQCGTSMASPHVSGAVALFIEYYRGITCEDPSPALIKAAFTVMAHDLAGNQDADGGVLGHPFDSKQGWGRMNTKAAVDPDTTRLYFDNPTVFDNTGETWEHTVYTEVAGEAVRVMLVWTDAPGHGLGGSTPAWNNDLDLEIEIDGTTYKGNHFGSNGWSISGGIADEKNNTEGVFVESSEEGSVKIRVIASNISSDGIPNDGDTTDQDFSLVVTNCINQSSDGQIIFDQSIYTQGDSADVQVSDFDLKGLETVSVTISSDSEPQGEIVVLTEIEPDSGIFEGGIVLTLEPGIHDELTIDHGDEILAEYYDEDTGSGSGTTKTATAEVDTMPPLITSVTVSDKGADRVVIEWVTSEPSTSGVRYGNETPPDTLSLNDAFVINHELELMDLDCCSIYYFSVLAEDQVGNSSEDDSGGSYYFFLTNERIELINENMDMDPGWSTTGDWEWGQPTGEGGSYGEPDPSSGYTGDTIYGYNLSGDYSNNLPEQFLTMSPFDCSDGEGVTLSFYRWLGVESDSYDHAVIEISNNGGSTWNMVWENGGTIEGGSWELVSYDISSWADGQENVQLRWGMGPTDSGWSYCGWNIDDVLITYERECFLPTPTPSPTASFSPSPLPVTPTMMPTFTPSSTPTPTCSVLGVTITMPSNVFEANDICFCDVTICNPGPECDSNIPLFVILDVYGDYFFAPDFSNFDFYSIHLDVGRQTIEILPEFLWPPQTGVASGIIWYAAMTDKEITCINGEMDMFEFGWNAGN